MPSTRSPRAGHRVYLKRMLLAEGAEGVLPEWAFFARCVFDVGSKTVRATWTLSGEAKGVAVSGAHVYVGQPDGVLRLDPSTGAATATVSVRGLTAVQGVIG